MATRRSPADIKRIKRVKANLDAKRAEVPALPKPTPPAPPLEDGMKKDGFDHEVYGAFPRERYTPSYFDKQAKKAEKPDVPRETVKPKKSKKKSKGKDAKAKD